VPRSAIGCPGAAPRRRQKAESEQKRRVAFITEHLNAGRMVQLTTYTKATRYTKKHINMFKATKSGQ
jgi:hypothetical protein